MKAPFEPELAKESENPNKYTEEYSYSYGSLSLKFLTDRSFRLLYITHEFNRAEKI